MSDQGIETVLTGLSQIQINDFNVNKIRRRRYSIRIQDQIEKRDSLGNSLDLLNNNLFVCDKEIDKEQNKENVARNDIETMQPNADNTTMKSAETEYELECENIHYQRALKQFTYITQIEYRVRRSKGVTDDDGGDCGCSLTASQIQHGVLGCREDCLNRQMFIECDEDCKLGKLCSNQQFKKFNNAPCTIFITEMKGFGLFASKNIAKGTFIMEFVGEVVSMTEFKKRSREYAKQKTRHCYVMTSSGNKLIDATKKGNLTRFVNHSCDPNAETQKWTVNKECRIGVFSRRAIKTFEEITINYQFERFGKDAQECFCESSNCSGWIGS